MDSAGVVIAKPCDGRRMVVATGQDALEPMRLLEPMTVVAGQWR